ncbi:hypothetical protein ACFFHM_07545 [Halalkalibacter kiskunsagensis]|uniref:Uncharacterized protein n=1 Tax=Halalkalibacter kiskunsagensis TaxID=1548599 RepID=A0ABV6KAN9_9BACI
MMNYDPFTKAEVEYRQSEASRSYQEVNFKNDRRMAVANGWLQSFKALFTRKRPCCTYEC